MIFKSNRHERLLAIQQSRMSSQILDSLGLSVNRTVFVRSFVRLSL